MGNTKEELKNEMKKYPSDIREPILKFVKAKIVFDEAKRELLKESRIIKSGIEAYLYSGGDITPEIQRLQGKATKLIQELQGE